MVSGSPIDATIIGSVMATRRGYMYTSNSTLGRDLNGNTFTGAILYTPQTTVTLTARRWAWRAAANKHSR
jgi:hypothetical protein